MARDKRSSNDRYQDYNDYDEYRDSRRGESQGEGDYGFEEDYSDGYQDGYADDGFSQDSGYDDQYADDGYYEEGGYEDDYEDAKSSRRSKSRGRDGRNERSSRSSGGSGGKKKGGKKKIILIIELIALLAIIIIFFAVSRMTKINKVNGEEVAEAVETSVAAEVKESTETGEMKGYRNIALFGVDSTVGEIAKNTRSDTIIILSINEDTNEVKLCSVYRDTYLNLGNDDYGKCNAAYAAGGPEQAIKMLNMNLDMNITDYVTVGFQGLTDAINAVGGVDIDVDEVEMHHLNSYQTTMSEQLGSDKYPFIEVTTAGLQHLNGLQATAYCRIRYTAGDDFKRAYRQREVIRAFVQVAMNSTPDKLLEVYDSVAKEIYTSLDASEMTELITAFSNYKLADENANDQFGSGFPTTELRSTGYVGAESVVMPVDLEQNVIWLHYYLFGEDWTPSSKVKECSEKIANITGCYASKTAADVIGGSQDQTQDETQDESQDQEQSQEQQ